MLGGGHDKEDEEHRKRERCGKVTVMIGEALEGKSGPVVCDAFILRMT